jgi:hypothetical protein
MWLLKGFLSSPLFINTAFGFVWLFARCCKLKNCDSQSKETEISRTQKTGEKPLDKA